MKTKSIPLITMLSISLLSFEVPQQLLGYWKITKIVYQTGHTESRIDRWLGLLEEGKMEGGDMKTSEEISPPTKMSTWSYEETKNMLTLDVMKKYGNHGDYQVLNLGKKDLLLLSMRDSMQVYLRKVASSSERPY